MAVDAAPELEEASRTRAPFGQTVYLVVLVLVAAGAAGFRLPLLSGRPMHGDEANEAHKAGRLIDDGFYRYDPKDHHGPTLYYLTLPVVWLTGTQSFADSTEQTFRIVPALFGIGLVLLLWLLRRDLGYGATLGVAILTAVSPAMVFYSRYYIQETLLVFFTFAVIACGQRYLEVRKLHWALLAGAFLGLAQATKETAVLAWAAMAGGLALTFFWAHWRRIPFPVKQYWRARDLLAGAAVAVIVAGLFYSSFFSNPRGLFDAFHAYVYYLDRAGGAGLHDHPWHFYLRLLGYVRYPLGPRWSEGFILAFATVGAAFALFGSRRVFPAFVAFFVVLLTVFYAAIPYKTPWCVLSFLEGMILLAGYGMAALYKRVRLRWVRAVSALLFAAGAAHLGLEAYRASYVYEADPRNPYVYAHTSSALMRLVDRIEDLAAVSPKGKAMLIRVIEPTGDYWPLPWYLRRYTRVGYWNASPDDADADVVITSPAGQSAVEAALEGNYQVEYQGLRPGVLRIVYIQKDLWDAFIATRR
jgi:uncharacterized protein (TIGR03663 family)